MERRGEPSFNGCNDLLIIPGGNGCMKFPQLRVLGISIRDIS
jgi:hypothetical protein